MKQELLDKVLDQIVKDVISGDMTAVEVLLANVSDKEAMHFLPEDFANEEGDGK